MAVQSDTSRIQYAGNNSTTTSYAVPFVFQENSHLKAIARTSAGVESVVTLTNHTGSGNVNGGTVRTAVAVPATSTLTIYREVPATQTTTYAEGGDFPAASHERALDKLTQIAQQTQRQVGSTIRFSEANQIAPINPPVSATPHVLTTVNGGAPTWETVPSVSFPNSLNALTDATTVNAADELIIQQGGITKRATAQELFISTAINEGIKLQGGLNISGNDQQFAQNGAIISRMGDRVFVDAANAHTANFPVTTPDWHGAFQQTLNVGSVVGAVGSASTTSGSAVVTFTAGNTTPVAGQRIYGNGIADGTTVQTVDSSTQITLSANATATTSGGTLWSSDPTLFYNGAAFGSIRSVSGSKSPCAGLFATRTLDFTSAGSSCIPLQAYAVNNNATLATSAWALYLESHRTSNSVGASYGIELNVVSTRSSAEIAPHPFQQGQTVGIQIGAGAGLAGTGQQNCSAAIQVVSNPVRWRAGIVFGNRSLEGTDGYSGEATAIALAGGHRINWYNPSGQIVGSIRGNTGMSNTETSFIRFAGVGIQFNNAQNTLNGYIFTSNTTLVNYFGLAGATTGNPVVFSANGADTNVDLRLSCQGTGVLRFGTHAAVTTETVTGFITIKDAAGNTRKLAVVS